MEKYFVKLSSCVNPDHPISDTNIKIKPFLKEVKSLAEASKACRQFIKKNELGGGNWNGGEITNESKMFIGRVSYNGRIWPNKVYVSGEKEIIF